MASRQSSALGLAIWRFRILLLIGLSADLVTLSSLASYTLKLPDPLHWARLSPAVVWLISFVAIAYTVLVVSYLARASLAGAATTVTYLVGIPLFIGLAITGVVLFWHFIVNMSPDAFLATFGDNDTSQRRRFWVAGYLSGMGLFISMALSWVLCSLLDSCAAELYDAVHPQPHEVSLV